MVPIFNSSAQRRGGAPARQRLYAAAWLFTIHQLLFDIL